MSTVRTLAILFLSVWTVQAQEYQKLVLSPQGDIQESYITYARPQGRAVGIIVYLSCYDKKPTVPRRIDQDLIDQWALEATKHNLVFAQFQIVSPRLSTHVSDGRHDLRKGLGKLVVDQSTELLGKDPAIFLFPSNPREAKLIMQAIDAMPANFSGWCVRNYLPEKDISAKSSRLPGLLISATDYISTDKLKAYFAKARKQGKLWTFLAAKPSDESKVREFIVTYFESCKTAVNPVWRLLTELQAPIEHNVQSLISDPEVVPLPNEEVAKTWETLMATQSKIPTVVEETIQPSDPKLEPLRMYLRLPPGSKDASGVDGLLAYCTWVSDRKALMQQLMYDTDRPADQLRMPAVQMLKYASAHNLAVLTWSTPGRWNAAVSSDDLQRKEVVKVDRLFDIYSLAWDQGISIFVDKYKIPENDYLLYGFSRGAQWAHRLALRRPGRFLAVNIHVNSSYDAPTVEAAQCLWLVSTGDLEGGYPAAKRFYETCLGLHYPVLFKAGPNLGHDTSPEIEALRNAFFDFALETRNQRLAKGTTKQEMAKFVAERLPEAPFIGDLLNQEVFPKEEISLVPAPLRVFLPDQNLADAWLGKSEGPPETVPAP